MAASYSSFLTTQYYSPVFNTALFDGPFRIYFSQSYESIALKIYHLLQAHDLPLWTDYKAWSEKSKKHAFILIYPSVTDLASAFDQTALEKSNTLVQPLTHVWEEGLILGLFNISNDENFQSLYSNILQQLKMFMENEKQSSAAQI